MIRVSRLLARIINAIIAVSNTREPTARMTASAAVMRWSVFRVHGRGVRNRDLPFQDTCAVNRLVPRLVSKPLSSPAMGDEIGAAESTRVAGGATGSGLCHRAPHKRNG